MTTSPAGFLGRERETGVLGQVIEGAKRGESGAVVVRGGPGMGKTALLEHVVQQVPEVRVARVAGVESEMELPFAALHQLCAPMLDRLEALPAPQADALSTAFGLREGDPPDRFLVGLGVLSMVAGLGAEQPLVCVVDDAQWLDHASGQTMAFVARRLLADPVAWLVAARTDVPLFDGLPELMLDRVDDRSAGALLDSALPFALDTEVRDRILAEADGNPLALLELPRGLSPDRLAGGFGVSGAMPVTARIEATFGRRLKALPPDTQALMVVAAAEPAGNPIVVLRAANALGIHPEAGDAAEEDGLLEIGDRVTFRHPLVRSVAYQGASPSQRSRAHQALADATDPETDPDRRAWHLAQASSRPNDEVAAELERCAGRAQARGGYAAAAAFLDRSASFTSQSAARSQRALAAAHAKHLAGANSAALDALVAAESGPLDVAQRAQASLLRAEIAYTERRGSDAPDLLLRAARSLEPIDTTAARDSYLDAFVAARFAGRLAHATGTHEVATAVRQASLPTGLPGAPDILLEGLTTAFLDGFVAGVPGLQRAVSAFRDPSVSSSDELRWMSYAAHVAMSLWDEESYAALSSRHIEVCRQTGLLAMMPTALTGGIISHALAGQLTAADQLIRELVVLTDAMEVPMPPYGSLVVSAWRGREGPADQVRASAIEDVTRRGEGAGLAYCDFAKALLSNGLGRYDEALLAASSINPLTEAFVADGAGRIELIEAAARSGALDQAHTALEQLSYFTQAAGTDWAIGVQARSRALISPDDQAEDLYREAIDALARTPIRPQLARAHLIYGEWLRRQNRRVDARTELRTAYDLLSAIGIDAFAERARHELLATGEKVRRRTVDTRAELTAQEGHICRLAVEGHTNTEIGAQLFISPRTVEWHLRKVFVKLGIASRRELRDALTKLDLPELSD